VVEDCIANNNEELTQACYPEFPALLAPEEFHNPGRGDRRVAERPAATPA
jgi:hypothetical protein